MKDKLHGKKSRQPIPAGQERLASQSELDEVTELLQKPQAQLYSQGKLRGKIAGCGELVRQCDGDRKYL